MSCHRASSLRATNVICEGIGEKIGESGIKVILPSPAPHHGQRIAIRARPHPPHRRHRRIPLYLVRTSNIWLDPGKRTRSRFVSTVTQVRNQWFWLPVSSFYLTAREALFAPFKGVGSISETGPGLFRVIHLCITAVSHWFRNLVPIFFTVFYSALHLHHFSPQKPLWMF